MLDIACSWLHCGTETSAQKLQGMQVSKPGSKPYMTLASAHYPTAVEITPQDLLGVTDVIL